MKIVNLNRMLYALDAIAVLLYERVGIGNDNKKQKKLILL